MQGMLDIILSLVTLTLLEIVLGIDNLIFLSIISQRLPQAQRKKARRIGLMLAWIFRLLLLACALWLSKLTKPIFHVFSMGISWRDVFLIAGGLFLLAKSTHEIHLEIEAPPSENKETKTNINPRYQFSWIITQIILLDIIFSLDSILTAIGLTQHYWIMASAITIAILAMIFISEPLSAFVERHPSIKMLALSFLILIGTVLIADGLEFHIPRGYIYFSIAFSLLVESLNLVRQKRRRKQI